MNTRKILTSDFFQNNYFQLGIIVSVLVNAALWALLYFRIDITDEPIALHYNVYFGINLIGSWYQAYVQPIIGIIVIVANNFLAYVVYKRERVASYILIFVSVVIQLILFFSAQLLTTFV